MSLRAKLGAVAPLKPACSQIARLQYKFHQAVDGDSVWLGSRIRLHEFGILAWVGDAGGMQ
ncbi:MAG: hypothetical protein QY329_07905 [Anaerolineales bacterium]|nr:MAG: hypothetical protein QY329_07905 [Anaerolineales bacterium]